MDNHVTMALVGSDSLLGREVRDLAATTGPGFHLRLIADAAEEPGKLTRVGDEPLLVEGLLAESLEGVRAVFLAGSEETSRKALEIAPDATFIDLTGLIEDRPDARLRAPLVEGDEESEFEEGAGGIHVIAHPAAIALALFLRRLHANDPIRRAVVQVFVPASERGTAGVQELQQQTVSLLSFKGMPKTVFDAQSAFTLLVKYGEEAPVPLETVESLIERHLESLLTLPGDGQDAPMPSLRVTQAPVFHGYSFSAWVQFETNPGVETLEQTLGTATIDVRGAGLEPPNNVGHAGMSGIAVGGIEPDHNDAEACWFWIVADNVRLVAENAVEVARRIL